MAKKDNLRICLTSAEFAPLAKTGGLADVTAALSDYLHQAGHDVRVLMPFYSGIDTSALVIEPVSNIQNVPIQVGSWQLHYSIDRATLPGTGMPVYLLRCPALYNRDHIYTAGSDEHLRFILLSRAAIEMCQRMQFAPHIFHCHDWHTALIPLYLRSVYAWDTLFADTRSVLTIHNIGYQGTITADLLPDLGLQGAEHHLHQDDLKIGRINFMKTGVMYAHLLTTVSPTYAREIQGATYGMGLESYLRQRMGSLIGILNGVDYAEWNPESDALIPAKFSADDISGKAVCKRKLMSELGLAGDQRQPLLGLVSRLAGQKGIDLIQSVVPELLAQRNFSFAILGSGERRYEEFFQHLQQAFPGRVCYYRGYSNKLAHWIEAGADIFLMPSLYEPCGLNQMYSLKYGTVPIVRQTGGLADSIELVDPRAGTGTGIVFEDYSNSALRWAINAALDLYQDKTLWRQIMRNGMGMDFSWQRQGALYVDLFRSLSNLS
ncbi:MAG: glycogen synthase GlgA [Gammaproteobacteria bacterium]